MSGRDLIAGLVPPSVADKRGKAFGGLMARAANDPQFTKLLFERIDEVDASVLPFLVREFSIEEFVEPGMSAEIIRALLKASYELHATKGFIHGVRRGLLMLGMRVIWKQWFQQVPPAAAGTHVATVFVNQTIFDGQTDLLDERVQRAAQRMISGMKRHSQDVAFQLGIAILARVGAATALQALSVVQAGGSVAPLNGLGSDVGIAAVGQGLSIVRGGGAAAPNKSTGVKFAVAAALQGLAIVSARMEFA